MAPSSKGDLPPLTTRDSRGSISSVPMHELEPSPVDDDEDAAALRDSGESAGNDCEKPARSSSPQVTATFLGLTPAKTIHILSSLQKYATIPPTVYLAMHYANTALIPLATQNVSDAEQYLLLTRPYYQSFPLEPFLIFLPIVTHVAAGIGLRIYRRRLNARRHGAETHSQRRKIPWPKFSLTSALGYAIYPMFVAHVLAMRITPNKVEGSSSGVGLRYFAHGIARHPILGNLGYSIFVSVASSHFVMGAAKFLRLSPEYITERGESGATRKKWRGRLVSAVAGALAAIWIAGGLGVVGRGGLGTGWEAKNWDHIYQSLPVIGAWV